MFLWNVPISLAVVLIHCAKEKGMNLRIALTASALAGGLAIGACHSGQNDTPNTSAGAGANAVDLSGGSAADTNAGGADNGSDMANAGSGANATGSGGNMSNGAGATGGGNNASGPTR
jgi:hypothetical protein